MVSLQLWDTAGQEEYAVLGAAFYRAANCCVLVFDLSNRQSFVNLAKWQTDLSSHLPDIDPKKTLVVGNKQDLERQVHSDEAIAWCH
jgi:Ras-related protein Rab-7A